MQNSKCKILEKTTIIRKAQMLVETIIGVGVIGIVLSAIIPLFIVGVKASGESWKTDSARFLGQEVLDQAKALKEENWNNIYTAEKGSKYYVENNAGAWQRADGEEVVTLNNLNFTRYFMVENVSRVIQGSGTPGWQFGEIDAPYNPANDDPSTQKITVKVSWENTSITLVDYLTRNKNSLWEQTDWSGGNYFTISTNFVPAGDIDTSTAGELKLGKIPGAVAHFGNEFVIDSLPAINIYPLTNQNYRVSMRFTAQQSGNVNQLRVYIAAQQRGDTVFYRYGLQGNDGGNPDGSYISSATANFGSTGWQTINLGSPAAVTAGTVYHLVIQYDSGSAPVANRYISIRATTPNNKTVPLNNANDLQASTLAYYSPPLPATWHDRNQQPLYVLGFDDSTYEGNPYDARGSRAIYGTRFEGETFTLENAKSVSGVGIYVAASQDPLNKPADDNLYVSLLDITDGLPGVPIVNGETFAQPTDLTTSFDWFEHSFSGGAQTLEAGHQYQLYFSSPAAKVASHYLMLDMSTSNASPYYDLSWAGTDAQTARSADSGATFTDYPYIDLAYYFLVPGDQYADNGELTSVTFNTANELGAGYNRISWGFIGVQPANTTVKMQLAVNNDNASWTFAGPANNPADWYTLSAGENLWVGLHSNRYVRYKIRLETTDPTVTPRVDWVRINWAY